MSERKLRKCEFCGEWFNTTQEIMSEHLFVKHDFIEVFKIKLSFNAMNFREQIKFVTKDIARIFGVPAELLNMLTNTK